MKNRKGIGRSQSSICAALCALITLASDVFGARVYFTDQPAGANGYVVAVRPDGTGQQTILTASNAPDLRGIAFHRTSGRVFLLDNGSSKKIYSLATNGTDLQEVTPISSGLNADLEIDDVTGKLFWAENTTGVIRSADLNGGNVQTAVNIGVGETVAPYFFRMDRPTGYFYWGVLSSGNGPSTFRRASITNGAIDPTFFITTSTRTRDIAVDPRTSTAYWCDRQTGTIFKRALSGGVNQAVIGGMNAPHGIVLDLEAEKIYWADTGGRGNPPQGLSVRRVARCNFDGSEFENISVPLPASEPWGLTIDFGSPTYAEWRTRFFSVGSSLAGATDDADGDGAENLIEFAMGTHPRRASQVPLLRSAGTSFEYVRRFGTDITFTVEVSTNLSFNVWHSNGDGSGLTWTTQTSVVAINADFERVTVAPGPALAGKGKAFFVLRVNTP